MAYLFTVNLSEFTALRILLLVFLVTQSISFHPIFTWVIKPSC